MLSSDSMRKADLNNGSSMESIETSSVHIQSYGLW